MNYKAIYERGQTNFNAESNQKAILRASDFCCLYGSVKAIYLIRDGLCVAKIHG